MEGGGEHLTLGGRYFRDSTAIDKNVQYTLHRSSITW